MEQVLDKIAVKIGVDRQEKRASPDYLWFKNDRLLVAIEHENDFKEAILYSEIPSLLRTEADLRVLITYPSKTVLPANEMALNIEEQLKKRLTPEKNGSFIFLTSPKEWAKDPSEEPWVYRLWEFKLNQIAGRI